MPESALRILILISAPAVIYGSAFLLGWIMVKSGAADLLNLMDVRDTKHIDFIRVGAIGGSILGVIYSLWVFTGLIV